MKQIPILLLSLAAAVTGYPARCRTANAEAAPAPAALPPEFQKQLDDQAAQIAELQQQLAARNGSPAEPVDTGLLAILTQHAGLRLDEVRWRVQAGLDPEQAVAAALAQKSSDAIKAAASKSKTKK